MIHITEKFIGEEVVCISLEGVLNRDSLPLLKSLCLNYIDEKKRVTLNLEGLMHISREGMDFLREIQQLVILKGPPAFMKIDRPETDKRNKL